MGDVDADKAQTLKLKEVRGAVITLIDHDAPAARSGFRSTMWCSQSTARLSKAPSSLRRMLHEIPPGRKVSLEISRDGNIQTIAVELVDHKKMEHDVWNKLGNEQRRCSRRRRAWAFSPAAAMCRCRAASIMPFFGEHPQRGRAG